MKKSILLFFAVLSTSLLLAQDQTTFILVRHAEKANDGTRNPPLNDEGKQRAVNLADLLESEEITALYTTPYDRTRQTLDPLANKKQLEILEYEVRAGEDWLKELYQKHKNGTIVIAGHSNTIPILANKLLGKEVLSQFDDKEYSNLLVIVGTDVGEGRMLRLRF